MYEIFNLLGEQIDTVDLITARRLYPSVQYGWRLVGTKDDPS